MVEVEARDQERHVRLIAEGRSGTDDRRGGGVQRFEFPGRAGLDSREDQINTAQINRRRLVDHQRQHLLWRLFLAPPLPGAGLGIPNRLGIGFPRRPL